MIFKVTLSVVGRNRPVQAPRLANLDADQADFLERHVNTFRNSTSRPKTARFTPGQIARGLFEELLTADADRIEAIALTFVERLQKLLATTSGKDAVLAIITSGNASPLNVTALLLDADVEAASYNEVEQGRITFQVLQDLLPGPGAVRKALSWPDVRPGSDAMASDINPTEAKFFFNTFDVTVDPPVVQVEKEVGQAIRQFVQRDRVGLHSRRQRRAALARAVGDGDRSRLPCGKVRRA